MGHHLLFGGKRGMNKFPVEYAGSLCVWGQQPYHKGYLQLIIEGDPAGKKVQWLRTSKVTFPPSLLTLSLYSPFDTSVILYTKKNKKIHNGWCLLLFKRNTPYQHRNMSVNTSAAVNKANIIQYIIHFTWNGIRKIIYNNKLRTKALHVILNYEA